MASVNESHLLETLRVELQSEFDLLGFLGRSADGSLVYLAREIAKGNLVALAVTSGGTEPDGTPSFDLSVRESLDASVPDVEAACPQCQSTLRAWARFCTQCGTDVSGISASSSPHSRATLLAAVRSEADADLEVLGDMPRAEGGGLVYFARERHTGRIVGLRLARQADQSYDLKVTRVLGSASAPVAERPERVSFVRRWQEGDPEPLLPARTGIDGRVVIGIVVVAVGLVVALLL